MTDVTGQTPLGQPRNDATDGSALEPRTFTGTATATRRPTTVRAKADDVTAQTENAIEQGESLLVAGIETAQAKAEQVQRWAEAKRDTARDHIRAHPISSCATVFGVGLVFGMLMRGR